MTILKDIAEYKIISRLTASIILLGGTGTLVFHYLGASTINNDVLVVIAAVISACGTFLFMSEKS